jgi:hypothetical protein
MFIEEGLLARLYHIEYRIDRMVHKYNNDNKE